MSYAIDPGKASQVELRRIAAQQLEKALEALVHHEHDVHATVHVLRRRFKKVRALLRLFRDGLGGTYHTENVWLRDTARVLSDLRDAQAALQVCSLLREQLPQEPPLEELWEALLARRQSLVEQHHAHERLEWVRERTQACLERSAGWELADTGFQALAGGLERTYQRARVGMNEAYESQDVDDFHEWRKRAKYHRYHLRLLRQVWGPLLAVWEEELHGLTDLLGEAHDLSRLRAILTREEPGPQEARELLLPLIDARRSDLRLRAWPLGCRAFAESPRRLVRRLGRFYEVVRAQESGWVPAEAVTW